MIFLGSLFHFLGSVFFSILLFVFLIVFVATGTFIESKTDSHAYAMQVVFQNPIFSFFLFLVFINILFASLRRFPFQKKHIPFLITHLGLLLIILGVIGKNFFGIQGVLEIWEGESSSSLLLPYTQAVEIENRKGKIKQIPLFSKDNPFVSLKSFYPDSETEKIEWMEEKNLHLIDYPPFPIQIYQEEKEVFPSGRIFSNSTFFPTWDIYAVKKGDKETILEKVFWQGLTLELEDGEKKLFFQDLSQNSKIFVDGNEYILSLVQEKEHFFLKFKQETKEFMFSLDELTLPITGYPLFFSIPFKIQLKKNPLFLFWQDLEKNTHIFAIDPFGRIFSKIFLFDQSSPMMAYDAGFLGYSFFTQFSFPSLSPHEYQREKIKKIKEVFLSVEQQRGKINPAVFCFLETCKKEKLEDPWLAFIEFLSIWKQTGKVIFSEKDLLSNDLQNVIEHFSFDDKEDKKISDLCYLLKTIEQDLFFNHPLPFPFSHEKPMESFENLAQNFYLLSDTINPFMTYSPNKKEELLSSFFLLFGIQPEILNSFEKPLFEKDESNQSVLLETPVFFRYKPKIPRKKIEERESLVVLDFFEDGKKETICLTSNTAIKTPLFQGKYLVSLKPLRKELPYTFRVQEAKKLDYPGSQQPFSFVCRGNIKEKKTGKEEEVILSMNQVYETKNGYRFYLSHIITSKESGIKKVRIIVNFDPFKYICTYPGGFFLVWGVFELLFGPLFLGLIWKRKKEIEVFQS